MIKSFIVVFFVALLIYFVFNLQPDETVEEHSEKVIGLEVKSDYIVKPLFNERYRKQLKEKIGRARQEIFVAMYVIEPVSLMAEEDEGWDRWREDHVKEILDRLIEASRRGVEVLVVLSRPSEANSYKTKSNKMAKEYLVNRGLVVDYNQSPTSLHDKFVAIDGKYIFQGSHNWTNAALGYNHEQSLLMEAVEPGKDIIWDNYREFLSLKR